MRYSLSRSPTVLYMPIFFSQMIFGPIPSGRPQVSHIDSQFSTHIKWHIVTEVLTACNVTVTQSKGYARCCLDNKLISKKILPCGKEDITDRKN